MTTRKELTEKLAAIQGNADMFCGCEDLAYLQDLLVSIGEYVEAAQGHYTIGTTEYANHMLRECGNLVNRAAQKLNY